MERAQAGDAAAVWELAETWRPYLRAVVTNVVQGRLPEKFDASDVVQQGLAAAIEQFAQFRGGTAAEWQAWLVAVVKNEARNHLRHWGRQRRDADREAGGLEAPGGGESGVQPRRSGSEARSIKPETAPDPGEQALRRERAMLLMAALERLPDDDARVIRLRHFDGLSHAEIAKQMGRSEAAVRQMWVRALRRLKTEVGSDL